MSSINNTAFLKSEKSQEFITQFILHRLRKASPGHAKKLIRIISQDCRDLSDYWAIMEILDSAFWWWPIPHCDKVKIATAIQILSAIYKEGFEDGLRFRLREGINE